MRTRKKIYLAVAAAALAAAATSVTLTHASTSARATPVGEAVTIPGTAIQWAPPPADADPALTADQAWTAEFSPDEPGVPDGTTVQLGSLTDAIGEYCGASCDSWQTVDGISYRAYHQLAYGYYWRACTDSQAELDCQHWEFIDANTGEYIMGVGPRMGMSPLPSDIVSPEPSASASG
jgi:hypothetical protein